MTVSPPLLEARHVRRTVEDGVVLLDDVSLGVAAGSSTAIVGPPGSGKTLLLRALALLDPLQGGEVLFRGEPIADHDVPNVRRQAVLLQQRPVLIEGTVRENLQLAFSASGQPQQQLDERQVVSRLSVMGRDASFLEREVGDLSGGESQIVALLRALMLEPVVLLLDEPTSSLDAQTTEIVERLIADWQQDDAERALVVVTHALDQAARLAQRTITMQNGRILSQAEAVR